MTVEADVKLYEDISFSQLQGIFLLYSIFITITIIAFIIEYFKSNSINNHASNERNHYIQDRFNSKFNGSFTFKGHARFTISTRKQAHSALELPFTFTHIAKITRSNFQVGNLQSRWKSRNMIQLGILSSIQQKSL